jgi:hypothetical protein
MISLGINGRSPLVPQGTQLFGRSETIGSAKTTKEVEHKQMN